MTNTINDNLDTSTYVKFLDIPEEARRTTWRPLTCQSWRKRGARLGERCGLILAWVNGNYVPGTAEFWCRICKERFVL